RGAGSEGEDLFHRPAPGCLRGHVEQGRYGQDELGARVPELPAELARRVEGVDRADDTRQRGDGENGCRVIEQVRAVEGQHVTFAESPLAEPRGDAAHRVSQFAVGDGPAVRTVNEGRSIVQAWRVTQHVLGDRHVRDVRARMLTGDDHAWPPRHLTQWKNEWQASHRSRISETLPPKSEATLTPSPVQCGHCTSSSSEGTANVGRACLERRAVVTAPPVRCT